MQIVEQQYELVALDALHLHPRNVNQGDIGAIHGSIAHNGFYGAVIAQRSTGRILAGNHRYQAATQSKAETIPVIWVDVDDEAALRILLADNRTTRLGHDDPAALAELLQEIQADTGTLDGTGYDGDALDQLLKDLEGNKEAEPPEDFDSFDENVETEHKCPKCGYEWSGKAK